jgi:hypothetical protein
MVKLAFVERYCNPRDGWDVFVDIDPSEEGRTGGRRKTPEAVDRQRQMLEQSKHARSALCNLGVHVGDRQRRWRDCFADSVPRVDGDRDIVAIHTDARRMVVAEVEGVSAAQPETKVYKAIGQIVCAARECQLPSFNVQFVIAVCGPRMMGHLQRASILAAIGVSGVGIAETHGEDQWVFGEAPARP